MPLAAVLPVCGLALFGCSSGDGTPSVTDSGDSAACPATPVNVVVSVDQWGEVVSDLGGDCANVTTVLAGSSADPHDFEPSPAQAAAFNDAQLIVINGADYDHWASALAATSAPDVPVVDAAEVILTPDTADPHLWYSPVAVAGVADAVTEQLSKLEPAAAEYFAAQREGFTQSLEPYTTEIEAIKSQASGKTYAATESVFDYMAEELGLVNKTPLGYQNAAGHHSDPAPADLAAFRTALAEGDIDVLIYNTQTHGSIPGQLRVAAEEAGVPVVDVTETVPPGADSFESWQVPQLTALAKALGVQR